MLGRSAGESRESAVEIDGAAIYHRGSTDVWDARSLEGTSDDRHMSELQLLRNAATEPGTRTESN